MDGPVRDFPLRLALMARRLRSLRPMTTIEERLAAIGPGTDRMETVKTIGLFLAELEKGTIRSAIRDEDGEWHAQTWVKEGILLAFRAGVATEFASGALSFIDKDTIPTRRFRA